jgi:hypothetical protein
MKKSVPIRLLLVVSSFALLLFEISSIYGQHAQQPWIESGPDKGVLARHSKSPDGRYALAWVVTGDQAAIDWELLRNAPDSFYEKYMIYASCGLLIWRKIESFVHWAFRSVMFGPEVIAL